MRRIATSILIGLALLPGTKGHVKADAPDLAELRTTLADESIPVEERARRALEGAGSLDQAAQQAAQASTRRAFWAQAIGLLDDFVEKHPQVEAAPLIRFQAAVYRWAEGRSFADQADLAPADPRNRDGAIRALDDSTRRLRAIVIKAGEAADGFAQNVRFRLAQSITDRSRFEPESDPKRAESEREALALLDATLTTPGLRPFARILRSELAHRLGL